MDLSKDVSREYIRKVLEPRNTDYKDGLQFSWQRENYFSGAVPTGEQAREILCAHEDNGLKRRIIGYCFRHKETIKKIPVIGKGAVQIEKKRLRKSIESPVLDMSRYLDLPSRECIEACYHKMLNREADSSGMASMINLAENGAPNEAFVYLIAISPEFAGRYKVKNIKQYGKRYKKYVRRQRIKNIPVLGRFIRLFTVSSQLSVIYNDLNKKNIVLEDLINSVNDRLLDTNNQLSELMQHNTSESLSNLNVISKFDKNLSDIQTDIRHNYDILVALHQKNDEELKIGTIVSDKMDALPEFITAKNIQSRTSIASYSDGVVGVQCGDYFFGVPSEEWGFAYFLMTNGHFEYGSEKLFCSFLKPGMTVLDIGANLGIYTLHALKAGCEVYSFEPIPRTFDILEQNVKANGFADTGKAHLYNCAVSDKNGTVDFFYTKKMCGHSNMYQSEFDSDIKLSVPTVTVDDHLKEIHHVDVIKIDVEGAEYQAFCGMSRIIAENPQIKILIEFASGHIIRAGMQPEKILKYYSELGFYKYLITEKGDLQAVSDDELINCFSENLLLTKECIEL